MGRKIVPQYYVEDSHDAIIPKPLFYRIQEEKARRASLHKGINKKGKTDKEKYSSQFALTGIMTCGECGSLYRRTTWARNGQKTIVWRCISRLEQGTKVCKCSPTLREEDIEKTITNVINFVLYGTIQPRAVLLLFRPLVNCSISTPIFILLPLTGLNR